MCGLRPRARAPLCNINRFPHSAFEGRTHQNAQYLVLGCELTSDLGVYCVLVHEVFLLDMKRVAFNPSRRERLKVEWDPRDKLRAEGECA
jgi:hypothetical protein